MFDASPGLQVLWVVLEFGYFDNLTFSFSGVGVRIPEKVPIEPKGSDRIRLISHICFGWLA